MRIPGWFLLALVLPLASLGADTVLSDSLRREFNNLRIYQVMVASFADGNPGADYNTGYGPSSHKGDLRGIIRALPTIRSLGVNALWLTPVFDSDGGDAPSRLDATGYYPRDYFRVDPRFGSLPDLRRLVQRAHQLGLYVFLDGVFGHHKGDVPPSPRGHVPVGPPDQVDYPASLPFYTEVALYWIDTLDIDGWRLDQAQQVPIDAWNAINRAVRERCQERRAAGERWGTLGYMVGEVWANERQIARDAYGVEGTMGLPSAFDFPLRYRLVQALAVEESGVGTVEARLLDEGFATRAAYPDWAVPNLMLGNHDLVRFGDLIQRAGYGGPEHDSYWARHRLAFAFLAAHTGPITIYYNEEIGMEVAGFAEKVTDRCWEIQRCDDHVARTDGKLGDFTPREAALRRALIDLMDLRARHPALWNGERINRIARGPVYVDEKRTDSERVLFVMNIGEEAVVLPLPAVAMVGARGYRPLYRDGDVALTPSDGGWTLGLPPLSTGYFEIQTDD